MGGMIDNYYWVTVDGVNFIRGLSASRGLPLEVKYPLVVVKLENRGMVDRYRIGDTLFKSYALRDKIIPLGEMHFELLGEKFRAEGIMESKQDVLEGWVYRYDRRIPAICKIGVLEGSVVRYWWRGEKYEI